MAYFNCLHTAVTMVSLRAGYCSSTLCHTIIGNLVGSNCILLCKLTMCSSLMTLFLGIWLTRILIIWIQNLLQDASNMQYLHSSWKKSYLLYHFNISYFMECSNFISKQTRKKLTENQFCNIYNNYSKVCMLNVWRKNKLLTWNIQMFRRIAIRIAIKYCLQ
jgi:hypothetical protein